MRTLAVFFFLVAGFLQVYSQNDFRFGFQLSPQVTWLSTDDTKVNGSGPNLGLKASVIGHYFFRENYAIVTGIGFGFNQGGELLYDIGGNFLPDSKLSDNRLNDKASPTPPLPDGVKIRYRVQHVEIPLSLYLRTKEFGYFRYFFEAPRFVLGIRSQARGAIVGVNVSSEKENIQKDIAPFNFSWGFGGGVEYSLGESTALVAGLFYENGTADITKDNGQRYIKGKDDQGNDIYTKQTETVKTALRGITLRFGVIF